MYPTEQKPLWTPSPERIAAARVTAFRLAAAQRWGVALPDYEALHAWSVAQPEQFWTSVWEGDGVGGGVIGTRGERVLVDGHRMPGAKWFPDARLNFAQNLLRSRDARDAIVFWGEERVKNRMSHGELYRAVAHFAAASGLHPRAWRISSARTLWGSCSSQGIIRLNWRLIQLPAELIDYVVVHELAHLRELNHSVRFWATVEKILPGHELARKRLRDMPEHLSGC